MWFFCSAFLFQISIQTPKEKMQLTCWTECVPEDTCTYRAVWDMTNFIHQPIQHADTSQKGPWSKRDSDPGLSFCKPAALTSHLWWPESTSLWNLFCNNSIQSTDHILIFNYRHTLFCSISKISLLCSVFQMSNMSLPTECDTNSSEVLPTSKQCKSLLCLPM